jgi:hypothetical protein
MNRLNQAMGVATVFTLVFLCFFFAFDVFSALINHTSMLQVLVDTVVTGALFFGFTAFCMYEFYRFIDERSRIDAEERDRRKKEREEQDRSDKTPPL